LEGLTAAVNALDPKQKTKNKEKKRIDKEEIEKNLPS